MLCNTRYRIPQGSAANERATVPLARTEVTRWTEDAPVNAILIFVDSNMYKLPAHLVQNFGHTHILCALRTKTTVMAHATYPPWVASVGWERGTARRSSVSSSRRRLRIYLGFCYLDKGRAGGYTLRSVRLGACAVAADACVTHR